MQVGRGDSNLDVLYSQNTIELKTKKHRKKDEMNVKENILLQEATFQFLFLSLYLKCFAGASYCHKYSKTIVKAH